MAIDATNNVGQVNQPQRKPNPAPLVFGLAGAATGYFMGSPVNTKQVLKKDTFELSSKAKDVTDADNANVKKINDALADSKEAKLNEKVDADVAKRFNGKEVLTAEEYLGKTTDALAKEITDAEGKTAGLDKAHKDAEKVANDAAEALKKADETGKSAAATAKETADNALKEAKTKLDTHTAKINADKAELEFAKSAKDGKITKEAVKTKIGADMKKNITGQIDEALEALKGKLPKQKSLKKAGLWGLGVFTGVWLLSKIFGGSKKEA